MPPAPDQAPPPPLPAFDRGQSAAEFAYHQLRAAIISLAMPPGTVLSRAALAARLGLSQTPVREALIRLQEETLIEVIPQSATRVARIDLVQARQAHVLRLAVEIEVARTHARSADGRIAPMLARELARQEAIAASDDAEAFIAADNDFHAGLFEAAGLPDLWKLIRGQSGHLDRLRLLNLPTEGRARMLVADHRRIADAILAGDEAAAEQAVRDHFARVFSQIDTIRARHPHVF